MGQKKNEFARLRGKFIVLDGPDGAGKSAQSARLMKALAEADVSAIACRDPGGTAIGDRIRSILLDHDLSKMDVACETLLFMASRAQLVNEIIRPALAAGKTVVCDRYVSSTCAYQGAAGYDPKKIIELAHLAIGDCWPDTTVVLDLDPQAGFERIGRKARHAGKNRKPAAEQASLIPGATTDAMEARPLEFHRRVRNLFLELPSFYPRPVKIVDASADEDQVFARIVEALASVLD
jgi:dTMP kinase